MEKKNQLFEVIEQFPLTVFQVLKYAGWGRKQDEMQWKGYHSEQSHVD